MYNTWEGGSDRPRWPVRPRVMMTRSREADRMIQNALCGKWDWGDTAGPPSWGHRPVWSFSGRFYPKWQKKYKKWVPTHSLWVPTNKSSLSPVFYHYYYYFYYYLLTFCYLLFCLIDTFLIIHCYHYVVVYQCDVFLCDCGCWTE